MIVLYFKAEDGTRNFGDELNLYLWPRYIPELPDAEPKDGYFIGIGTMLHRGLPAERQNVVFGAGSNGTVSPRLDRVYFVRGPLTATNCGLGVELAITDPAILLADTPPTQNVPGRIVYVPHWLSACEDLEKRCCASGLRYVDPRRPLGDVLAEISAATKVITESLHGAVVADAWRIPWVAVHSGSQHVNRFKWEDWCKSLELVYDPRETLEDALSAPAILSEDAVHHDRLARVKGKVAQIRADIKFGKPLVERRLPALFIPQSALAETPCGGMRVLLACPTYGNPDSACQKDLRIAMMVAANHGVVWMGDASTDRENMSYSRNAVCEAMLMQPEDELADGIMWVDSDQRMAPPSIASLLAAVRRYKYDFMTGIYYQRRPPHNSVIGIYNRKTQKFTMAHEFPTNTIAPVDGCGFGFCYTSRRLIEAVMSMPDFDQKKRWFPDYRSVGGFGEDYAFCTQAMAAGIQLYVHTGIEVGHSSDPYVVTRADYLKEQERKRRLSEQEKADANGG